MSKQAMEQLLIKLGWKKHGKAKPSENGSIYQEYRSVDPYKSKLRIYLGNYYVEANFEGIAVDYIRSAERRIIPFLKGTSRAPGTVMK